jgi:transposase
MGRAKHINLSEAEDEQLRSLEQGAGIHPKVRLRASILRLSHQGWKVPKLAEYFKRNQQSIHNDFKRWEERGIEGLGNAEQKGNHRVMTEEMLNHVKEKLKEERTWNCRQLLEALAERYGVQLGREALRLQLLTVGYSWQRARYAPAQEPEAELVEKAQATIEGLKRGHWQRS